MIFVMTCPRCKEKVGVSDEDYSKELNDNPSQYREGYNFETCPYCLYDIEFKIHIEVEDGRHKA